MTDTKEIVIKVPTSWDDVTVGQFQEMSSLDPGLDPTDKTVQIFSILADMDPADVEALPMDVIAQVASKLTWLSETAPSGFEKSVIVDNDIYAVIPNLDSLTVGEWVDLENYAADMINNLHLFIAILYRPVTNYTKYSYEVEEYDSVKMLERAKTFQQHMRVGTVYGAAVFFSLIAMGSYPSLRESLEEAPRESLLTMS